VKSCLRRFKASWPKFESFRIMLVGLGQGQATTDPDGLNAVQRVALDAHEFAVSWYMLRLIFIARKSSLII
jgi:hypothetical protein